MKEAIKQRTISTEEDTEFFGNGKDTMPMNALNELRDIEVVRWIE